LTEGLTWYGKYGFKISNKIHREKIKKSINVLKNIKVKDLDLKKLFRQIEKDLNFKYVDKDIYNSVKENLIKNPDVKLIDILNFIFVKNRSKKTNIIYSVMINRLLSQLENISDDFYRLKPTSYYLRI
jgi:hypothetical protein